MTIGVMVSLVVIIVYIIKMYYDNIQYWKKRGIPGPTPSLFSGNLWNILDINMPYPIQFQKWAEKYGSVYGYYDGWRRVLVINDVDMIHELLVKKFDDFYGRHLTVIWGNPDEDADFNVFTSHGQRWKRLRALASPAFGTANLKKIFPIVQDAARKIAEHFEKAVDADAINARRYCQEFTLDAITRLALGQEESTMFQNPFKKLIDGIFTEKLSESRLLTLAQLAPIFGAWCKRAQLWKGSRYPGTVASSDAYALIGNAVRQRRADRASGITRKRADLIDVFMETMANDTAISDHIGDFRRAIPLSERVITEEEIISQLYIIMTAGYDSTANALSCAMYEIAKNERVLREIQKELDEFCTEKDIDFNTINNLKYMDCAIKEALRMYPVAAFANNRQCMRDSMLGEMKIEKGVFVAANPWTIHYDKKIWGEDADEFRPERWLNEESNNRHPSAWLAFGAGPRQCVGIRLALLEEKTALAYLLRKFDLVEGAKTPNKLQLRGCYSTFPVEVPLYVRRRTDTLEESESICEEIEKGNNRKLSIISYL